MPELRVSGGSKTMRLQCEGAGMKRSMGNPVSVSREKQTTEGASLPKYLTQIEIRAILSVLHEEENRLMFLIGFDLGARVSEIAGLRWDCINWANKFVTIWDEKKDVGRTCTISADSWELLKRKRDSIDMREEKLVFPISHKTFNRRIKAWAKKAGIEQTVRWHTLRHTHIVQARRAGRDWNEIAQQTGDSLSTLVHTYGVLSIEDRVEMTEKRPLIQPEGDSSVHG